MSAKKSSSFEHLARRWRGLELEPRDAVRVPSWHGLRLRAILFVSRSFLVNGRDVRAVVGRRGRLAKRRVEVRATERELSHVSCNFLFMKQKILCLIQKHVICLQLIITQIIAIYSTISRVASVATNCRAVTTSEPVTFIIAEAKFSSPVTIISSETVFHTRVLNSRS